MANSAEFPDVHFTGRALLAMPAQQLHPLYKLRVDVFVAEQNCPYNEIDDQDANPDTRHVLAIDDAPSATTVVGCARVFPTDTGSRFGRFVVRPDYRGTGLGHEIVRAGIQALPRGQMESARSLGLSYMQAMRRVILPLAMPGVVAAVLIVFIPTIGDYVTPTVIGGGKIPMVANLIQAQRDFFGAHGFQRIDGLDAPHGPWGVTA